MFSHSWSVDLPVLDTALTWCALKVRLLTDLKCVTLVTVNINCAHKFLSWQIWVPFSCYSFVCFVDMNICVYVYTYICVCMYVYKIPIHPPKRINPIQRSSNLLEVLPDFPKAVIPSHNPTSPAACSIFMSSPILYILAILVGVCSVIIISLLMNGAQDPLMCHQDSLLPSEFSSIHCM